MAGVHRGAQPLQFRQVPRAAALPQPHQRLRHLQEGLGFEALRSSWWHLLPLITRMLMGHPATRTQSRHCCKAHGRLSFAASAARGFPRQKPFSALANCKRSAAHQAGRPVLQLAVEVRSHDLLYVHLQVVRIVLCDRRALVSLRFRRCMPRRWRI